MSQHEKFAWGSLIVGLLAWLFLTMRMTEGWVVVDASPRHMIWTYGGVVLLMIVAHAVLAGVFGGGADKDERDLAIAARAERMEGLVVLVSVNVLIIHALAQAAFAGEPAARASMMPRARRRSCASVRPAKLTSDCAVIMYSAVVASWSPWLNIGAPVSMAMRISSSALSRATSAVRSGGRITRSIT